MPTAVQRALAWQPALQIVSAATHASTGPISLRAWRQDEYALDYVDAVEWPFAFPIEEIWADPDNDPYAMRTLSGEDAALARELRDGAPASDLRFGRRKVRSGEHVYDLYLRDDLDAALVSALADLRARR